MSINPFARWVGSKKQLLPELKRYMPTEYDNYFEPFFGGGSLLFDLCPKNATINDYNSELMNAYRDIKNNPKDLIGLLNQHAQKNSKEYFYKVRNADRDGTKLSGIEKSARIIYLLQVDFNGLYRVNKKNQFNVPFGNREVNFERLKKNVNDISEYLNHNNVEILDGDFSDSLYGVSENDFVYFDPPYVPLNKTSNFTRYTSDGFGFEKQKQLKETFDELTRKGVHVMLSNSNTSEIKGLYQDYSIHEVSTKRTISSITAGRKVVTELIIENNCMLND